MKKHILVRTNLIICLIVLVGFAAVAVLSYRANYESSVADIEQITTLSSEGITFRLSNALAKPLNVSLAISHDTLLRTLLLEEPLDPQPESFLPTLREYLSSYYNLYQLDSVFIIPTATGRYYNASGLLKTLSRENEGDRWYYDFLADGRQYVVNVTHDSTSRDEITAFINYKLKDSSGNTLAVVGIGQQIDYLQSMMEAYELEFGVTSYLVNGEGFVEICTQHPSHDGYDFFENSKAAPLRSQILSWKSDSTAQNFWLEGSLSEDGTPEEGKSFWVARYLPDLSWYLIVKHNTGELLVQLEEQFYCTAFILLAILITILGVITYVIHDFHTRLVTLTKQQEVSNQQLSDPLYGNICEIDLTKNRAAGISTERYFEAMGIPQEIPFDKALHILAGKQVKEEFFEGYIETFSTENVLKQFEWGNQHLQYEFLARQADDSYRWTRIDAHLYRSDDGSVHMFTYYKDIDAEKRQIEESRALAKTDLLTKLFHKQWTRRLVEETLSLNPNGSYALFLFDIDCLKEANDLGGYSFGDALIAEFAEILRARFRPNDILGRMGGDEFAAFIPIPDEAWVHGKTKELANAFEHLCTVQDTEWNLSASIGIAIYPIHGANFETLYRNADTALYQSKRRGKNSYTLYDGAAETIYP